MQPWHAPFPILNQSIVPCPILTCFLSCIQEAGKVVLYSHLFKNIPQFVVIHTVEGFSIVNEAEMDFLNSLAFSIIQQMLAIWSRGSSAFSKSSLNIWKFSVHILLKPSLKDFEHYLASMWNKSNCTVVWTFFGIAFVWDWNENWHCPVWWWLLSFPNLLAYWVQHTASSSRIWNSSTRIPSPPLALFVVILS